jgi:hypothetical protein
MLIRATPSQAQLVLRAMRTVATTLTDRDRATLVVFTPGWDFWGVARAPLDDVRTRYGVRPVDPADAADDPMPSSYRPVQ